jgi:hypothetical protein
MNRRQSVPEPLRRAGRTVGLTVGRATLRWREMPDFIVVGGQRCGTTSLFRALMSHPQIFRPEMHKGVNYFDLNSYRGNTWYGAHFPLSSVIRHKARRYGPPVVFEASGYYMYHPFAMERMARALPRIKVVSMLRNPVERAYSAYQHERARGYEWEPFERALELENERLVGEVARMRRDPAYESYSHRHHSYLHRGHYAEQLEHIYALVPSHNVHVMMSEDFFSDPETEFRRLTDFLGVRDLGGIHFDTFNARPRSPMAATTADMLGDYYRPHDDRLVGLLERELPWRSPAESGVSAR